MSASEAGRWPDVLIWLGRPAAVGERVRLDPDEAHHLLRVLRRGEGEAVVLADGVGGWIDARVVAASRGGAEVEVIATRRSPAEPRHALELGFPVLRPARTEWLLEKATELGVTRVVPLRTARGRVHGEKPERWRRVLRSASMQCLRSKPPELIDPTSVQDWCYAGGGFVGSFVGTPGGAAIPAALAGAARVAVGPEGDLTGEELEMLASAGFVPVDLGPRRLRAETAALTLVSLVARAQQVAPAAPGAGAG